MRCMKFVYRPERRRGLGLSSWAVGALVVAFALCSSAKSQTASDSGLRQPAQTDKATTFNPNTPMTAAQGAAILRELRAIRLLLQNGAAGQATARPPRTPQPARMRLDPAWRAIGSPDAPITMIEFTDLQCPVCRRFDAGTFAVLKKSYIDTGKVRFVSRDLPLPMHQYALAAAEAARCAGDQGKFWQFREAVLTDEAPPTPDVLSRHASELGLNLQRFQSCSDTGEYKALVEADEDDAATAGLRGTPSFVIGRAQHGWVDGVSMVGARPLAFFEQEIESLLNESSAGSATRLSARKAAAADRSESPVSR
ncbi:MAG: DsbA family protein [Terriglobia bacterium]